jgi:large repetitive protein
MEQPGQANRPPVASSDAYAAVAETPLWVHAGAGVLVNDSDPDGDELVAERASSPARGVVYLSPDGSFVYVPEFGFTGEDAFTYRASDGSLRSQVTTVTLTVSPAE